MRVFNIIIIVLNTLLFFILGGLLLATALSDSVSGLVFKAWQFYEVALGASPGIKVAVAGAGLAMMVLAFSTVLGNIQNRRYERTVVFHNPHGEVMIALGALEDLGKGVKGEVPGLKDIKLQVSARRKGLRVTARVSLWSDASLPKTTELVQESVRRYLQEIVGQEQEIRPRVIVGKVAFRGPDGDEHNDGEFRPRRPRRPVV
jgi:hypothetical protein